MHLFLWLSGTYLSLLRSTAFRIVRQKRTEWTNDKALKVYWPRTLYLTSLNRIFGTERSSASNNKGDYFFMFSSANLTKNKLSYCVIFCIGHDTK